MDNASCHYGNQCVEAHGNDELVEWQERFEYRKMRMQRACEKELFGKSFTEQLLEKWVNCDQTFSLLDAAKQIVLNAFFYLILV